MLIEQYPVGWAIDASKAEPVAAYLIDLPGVAMQGRTLQEAIEKLRAVVPEVLASYRRKGTELPTPSAEPSLKVGVVQMTWYRPAVRSPDRVGASEVEVSAEVHLQPEVP